MKGKKGLAKYVLEGHRPALEKHWPDSLQKARIAFHFIAQDDF